MQEFSPFQLFIKYHGGNLLPDWGMNFNSVNVPLVFLGDPAYPLQPWLKKPFIYNGNLTDAQKKFNYRLSHASVIGEHAYGQLKGRWCCLLKRLDISVNQVPELVASCCVLDNVCEIHGDSFDDDLLHGVPGNSNHIGNTHTISSDGENIRNALMAYFEQL
uniref:DDE Tnp4 domain-containing protein n=1 Tax=Amphimedon queenslandica TaxID=400682 RepID=A0A1X7U8G8_AMPQE